LIVRTAPASPTTEDRLRALVRELKPVRPIPPLRVGVAAATGIWLGLLGVLALSGMLETRPWRHSDWSDPAFLLVLVGLALLGFGSTIAALASVVPGRDRATRIGLGVGALGILIALTSNRLWISLGDLVMSREELAACMECLSHATGLGALTALTTCVFVGYGFLRRPNASAALALVGSVAFGAIVVHTSCLATSPVHLLVSHVLAPTIAAGILTLPTGWALRLLAERLHPDSPPAAGSTAHSG
jgi:hypothetical protein